MSYLPQFVYQSSVIPAGPWTVADGGTGYTVGDVLTLTGGSALVPATSRVATVDGGGAVLTFEAQVASGNYFFFPFGATPVTGGTGSGCTVTIPNIPEYGFYTNDAGLGSSISQCTIAALAYEHIFNPALSVSGYAGGVVLSMQAEVQESDVDPTFQVTLLDNSAATIFDGTFTWPEQTTVISTFDSSFYRILLSFNTSTQTIHLFINDAEWVLHSGSWSSTNPVAGQTNIYPPNCWTIGTSDGIGGIAQLYVAPTYTDFTVTGNRRTFFTTDGSWVDPSTYPSAPVNLYLAKGDVATQFAANHGTGGAWTCVANTANWYFLMHYWCAALVTTPENTPVTFDFTSFNFGTSRPGGTVTFNSVSANHGMVSVTGTSCTYTPNTSFVGVDNVSFRFGETMPAGYTQPTWGGTFLTTSSVMVRVGSVASVSESARTDTQLQALRYTLNEINPDVFAFPTYTGNNGFVDKAIVQTQLEDIYDPDTDSDTFNVTLEELSATGQTPAQYGTLDPESFNTDTYGVWGDRLLWSGARSIFWFFYAPYTTGGTFTAPLEINITPSDIGFSDNWFYWPWPIVWQGRTNPMAVAWDWDGVSQFNAFVVSHEFPDGEVINGVMFDAQYPSFNDKWFVCPDPDNNRNVLLTVSNDTGQLHIHMSSAVDGSTVADYDFVMQAADVAEVMTDGILAITYPVLIVPDGFFIYGPNNRFAQSSNANEALPKGAFGILLQKDLSAYSLQYFVPTPDDDASIDLLNNNQPFPYMVLGSDLRPFYMGFAQPFSSTPPSGTILSIPGPPATSQLQLTDIQITTFPVTTDDQITLRYSDDAGYSWSNGRLQSLGHVGEYLTAPTWYRLGMSRNRVYELSWSGARAEALTGVWVDVTIAAT